MEFEAGLLGAVTTAIQAFLREHRPAHLSGASAPPVKHCRTCRCVVQPAPPSRVLRVPPYRPETPPPTPRPVELPPDRLEPPPVLYDEARNAIRGMYDPLLRPAERFNDGLIIFEGVGERENEEYAIEDDYQHPDEAVAEGDEDLFAARDDPFFEFPDLLEGFPQVFYHPPTPPRPRTGPPLPVSTMPALDTSDPEQRRCEHQHEPEEEQELHEERPQRQQSTTPAIPSTSYGSRGNRSAIHMKRLRPRIYRFQDDSDTTSDEDTDRGGGSVGPSKRMRLRLDDIENTTVRSDADSVEYNDRDSLTEESYERLVDEAVKDAEQANT